MVMVVLVVRFTTTYAISVNHYYRHDIAEILLKVALKTLTLTHNKGINSSTFRKSLTFLSYDVVSTTPRHFH
jgi:hypothetical protein